MNPVFPCFRLTALTLACAISLQAHAQAMTESGVPAALTQAADHQRADYRQQQWQRLAAKSDRDSLIAAVLLGMPYELGTADESQPQPLAGHDKVEQRLAQAYGKDPLVAFTLALSCQIPGAACTDSSRYDALVRLAPDNAVHWLMLPNGGAPNDAQLHAAAKATQADTHLREMLAIVRTALAGQKALSVPEGVDAGDLALLLRRDTTDQVPLPLFRAVVRLCKTPAVAQREECIEVGRRLEADRSGSILSRMIGSTMVRRLIKGTPEETAAKQLRREYVWMSEQLDGSPRPYLERVQADAASLGEWTAWQRATDRLVGRHTPPADWLPKNPQSLLLSEERSPAPAK